jgi:hypothetical protein
MGDYEFEFGGEFMACDTVHESSTMRSDAVVTDSVTTAKDAFPRKELSPNSPEYTPKSALNPSRSSLQQSLYDSVIKAAKTESYFKGGFDESDYKGDEPYGDYYSTGEISGRGDEMVYGGRGRYDDMRLYDDARFDDESYEHDQKVGAYRYGTRYGRGDPYDNREVVYDSRDTYDYRDYSNDDDGNLYIAAPLYGTPRQGRSDCSMHGSPIASPPHALYGPAAALGGGSTSAFHSASSSPRASLSPLRTAPGRVSSLAQSLSPHHTLHLPAVTPTPAPPPRFVYTVKFKRSQRAFILSPLAAASPLPIKIGSYVKVEADRGSDLGLVVSRIPADRYNSLQSSLRVPPTKDRHNVVVTGEGGSCYAADLKRIMGLARDDEVEVLGEKREEEEALVKICRAKVRYFCPC